MTRTLRNLAVLLSTGLVAVWGTCPVHAHNAAAGGGLDDVRASR